MEATKTKNEKLLSSILKIIGMKRNSNIESIMIIGECQC